MTNHNGSLGRAKGTSTLMRAAFSPGMLLQHADLEQVNVYTRDLSRLLFKSLFGCGVVCGLDVVTTSDCGKLKVAIGAGVALACSGDPVEVPQSTLLWLDEVLDPKVDKLWVVLCGTVKQCGPRASNCCDEDEAPAACTRARHGFEIRVVGSRPDCVCGCPEPKDPPTKLTENDCRCVEASSPCYKDHYDGKCGCNYDDGSDCGCASILLARLDKTKTNGTDSWVPDYRVRRFIRPLLMRDPLRVLQQQQATSSPASPGATAAAPAPAPAPANEAGTDSPEVAAPQIILP